MKKYSQFGLIILFLVLTSLLGGYFQFTKQRPKIAQEGNEIPIVHIKKIEPILDYVKISLPANAKLRNSVMLRPLVSGQVVWVNPKLKAGDSFSKNETLFKIDPKPFDVAVEISKANVMGAKADLTLVKANADVAVKEWNILHNGQAIPDLVAKKPEIAKAVANVAKAEADYANALLSRSYADYKLPFNGRVQNSKIELGTFVDSAGDYGQVYDKSSLEFTTQISQDLWNRFEPSKIEAKIEIDGEIYLSQYIRAGAIIDEATRMREIIIVPENKAFENLTAGRFAEVTLQSKVPQEIYKVTEDMLENNDVLRIVTKDNHIQREKVSIIGKEKNMIYVNSMGRSLNVVTGSVSGLIDDMKVEIVEDK